MRWVERIAGALAGLLAVVAGLLMVFKPATRSSGSVTYYGPGVSAPAHAAILPFAIMTTAAAIALATLALVDARRPERRSSVMALILVLAAICATGVSALLAGDVSIAIAEPLPRHSGLIQQYNAGALFIPALLAVVVCLIAALWPRPARPVAV